MTKAQEEALAKSKKIRDNTPGGSGMFEGPKKSLFPTPSSASTKATILRDKIKKSKAIGADESLAKRTPGTPGRMQRSVSGMEKTAARLESRGMRNERSAKYRAKIAALTQMKKGK